MWRGRLFFLCLALALLSGCAPGGPVAEAGADAQLPADKLIAITFDDGPRRNTTERLLDGLQVLLCKQAAKIFQTICKKETALKRVLRNLLSAISFAQI